MEYIRKRITSISDLLNLLINGDGDTFKNKNLWRNPILLLIILILLSVSTYIFKKKSDSKVPGMIWFFSFVILAIILPILLLIYAVTNNKVTGLSIFTIIVWLLSTAGFSWQIFSAYKLGEQYVSENKTIINPSKNFSEIYPNNKQVLTEDNTFSIEPDVDNAIATYYLFKNGGIHNFRIFLATFANNPWTDVMIILIFVMLPNSYLSKSITERIEIGLAKLGIYKLFLTVFLGSPRFNPHIIPSWTNNKVPFNIKIKGTLDVIVFPLID